MQLSVDGEFYELREAKSLIFSLDPKCPRLKVLQRSGLIEGNLQNKEILTELQEDYKPTLF